MQDSPHAPTASQAAMSLSPMRTMHAFGWSQRHLPDLPCFDSSCRPRPPAHQYSGWNLDPPAAYLMREVWAQGRGGLCTSHRLPQLGILSVGWGGGPVRPSCCCLCLLYCRFPGGLGGKAGEEALGQGLQGGQSGWGGLPAGHFRVSGCRDLPACVIHYDGAEAAVQRWAAAKQYRWHDAHTDASSRQHEVADPLGFKPIRLPAELVRSKAAEMATSR